MMLDQERINKLERLIQKRIFMKRKENELRKESVAAQRELDKIDTEIKQLVSVAPIDSTHAWGEQDDVPQHVEDSMHYDDFQSFPTEH